MVTSQRRGGTTPEPRGISLEISKASPAQTKQVCYLLLLSCAVLAADSARLMKAARPEPNTWAPEERCPLRRSATHASAPSSFPSLGPPRSLAQKAAQRFLLPRVLPLPWLRVSANAQAEP